MLSGRAEELLRPFSSIDLAARPAVVAAVSGGGDSTALLVLLRRHLDRFAAETRLTAVTVDHALRPGSDAEARAVARLCAGLGVMHRTLRWSDPKPSAGLAAAARDARYRLLSQAADEAGADLVLTGHTADDQAETVLMRQAREPGRGLAGMAPATLFESRVWFARPLLATRRDALREFLKQERIDWIDDPTNLDQRYERPRVRRRLGGADGETALAEALRLAGEAAGRREALGEAAAELIRDHADRPSPGLLRLEPEFFRANSVDAAVYALRILLACVGGTPFLPDEARTAALYGRLAAGPLRAVLSRALADARGGRLFLLRETRGLPAPAQALDGMVWDGRYRVSVAGQGVVIGPAGAENAQDADFSASDVPASLVRAALAAEPAASHPAADIRLAPVLAPWFRFLPSFDLAPAQAAARLFGAPQIPAPPFRGHIGGKA